MNMNFSEMIDLTHEITENMPVWPGDPQTELEEIVCESYTVEKLAIGTHTGTHIGAPRHFGFQKGVEDFPISSFIVEAALFDVSKDRRDLEVKDVLVWQRIHGELTQKCVILRTGQSVFWDDTSKYFKDYPGFSLKSVEFLLDLGVRIFGTDAPGIDPSNDGNFLSNWKVFENGGFHLENMANLEKLPEKFWIVIAPLKVKGGGAPIRVVALV